MKAQEIGKLKSQSGQVLVLLAFGLVALIGMAGVVVDGGRSYADQRSLEAAAEAGAHAGAYLMEKSWNGEAGNFGSLTGAQVVATAQAFAGYNGWNSTDAWYMDYVKPDRTTHVATLDNTVRGVLVQVSKPQSATFTRVLGFKLYSVFARATAMFGAALLAGALPLAIDDGCTVPPQTYDTNVGAQPAGGGGSFGTCNFATIIPPGCVAGDSVCFQNAMAKGMNPPTQLGPPYKVNSFDVAVLSAQTAAALQARIDSRPGETCTNFKSPSPRVVWIPVVAGGFGGVGSTVNFIRYKAWFLTSITGNSGFSGCFVHATINGGDFDPNAVGTAYGGVMIMKLIRSTGAVVPVNVSLTSITNPAVKGAAGSTLSIHANQVGASCTVLIFDLPPAAAPTASNAGGLGPKITDSSGNATWTWTVELTALTGLAQVQVTCTYKGELGYLFTSTLIA
jgi:hypothetical protein